MRRLLLLSALSGILCLFATNVPAQEKKDKDDPFAKMPKPGAEHKLLESLTGTWDCKVKFWMGPGEPELSTGTVVREMILDGRYLHEKIIGKPAGREYHARGVIGYNVNKKKYLTAFVDNFGTGIETTTGTYDAATKTFTYLGKSDHGEMGGKVKTRDTLKIVSDSEQVMEMYRTPDKKGGTEMKVMEITLTKKKK